MIDTTFAHYLSVFPTRKRLTGKSYLLPTPSSERFELAISMMFIANKIFPQQLASGRLALSHNTRVTSVLPVPGSPKPVPSQLWLAIENMFLSISNSATFCSFLVVFLT